MTNLIVLSSVLRPNGNQAIVSEIADNYYHKNDLPSVMWQVSVGGKFSSVSSCGFPGI